MRVPYSWLREYAPDAPDDVERAIELLTVSGTMVEGVEQIGVADAGGEGGESFRVARVLKFEQHPNADRLRTVEVDDGTGVPRDIVCGASNFREGDNVALVMPGGRMPDGMEIKAAKLRGEASHGMLLSERELGLSTEHDGIMILPHDWQPGDHLHKHVPLGDTVLELEITGNRPDCLGMLGVARELATAAGVRVDDSVVEQDAEPDADAGRTVHDVVSVSLEAPDLCSRYMARAFVDVQVGSSPRWLKARLAHAGMRAINNVVDVTNYVMLVTGQPLHAFDADQLRGGKIVVRRAHEEEPVTTLDDVERVLDPSMLVIADAERPAVIAGIMGAADVEVTAETSRIVLEAASFDGPSIQRASRALALRSESSNRFEKGLDPHSPEVAMRLASRMLVELCGARMLPETIDERAPEWPGSTPVIDLPFDAADRLLGIEVTQQETEETLHSLGYRVERGEEGWRVQVPHWRMHDTTRAVDLVEEIGRFRLERIPSIRPAVSTGGAMLNRAQRLRRLVEDTAAGMGLTEVVTYGLVAPGTGERLGVPEEDVLKLANPMTVDHAELRTSMLPGHLEVARRNTAAGTPDLAIFEIGRTFHAVEDGAVGEDGLPVFSRERDALGVLLTGTFGGGRWDLPGLPNDVQAAVGVATALGAAVGVDIETTPLPNPPTWMHPGRVAELRATATGAVVGWVGSVHPTFAREAGVDADVHALQIDLASLDAARPGTPRFRVFSEFPPVMEDIAVVLRDDVHAGAVVRAAKAAGGDLVERVGIFDRYVGAPVPDGHYSLALQLTYRAPDRTLTAAETAEVRATVVAALEQQFDAQLRG